jgi:hypothetical protein
VSITPFGSPVVPLEKGRTRQVDGRVDRYLRSIGVCPQELGKRRGAVRLPEHEHLLDPNLLGRREGSVQERRHRDHEPSPRVVELVRDVLFRGKRVDRGVHAPGRRHAVEGHGILGDVGSHEGDHVTLCQAPGGECRRHAANPCAELCIGDGAPGRAVDQRRLVAESAGTLQDERRERDVRDVDIRQWASKDHDEPPWRSRKGRNVLPGTRTGYR